jgi:hypothetical protein
MMSHDLRSSNQEILHTAFAWMVLYILKNEPEYLSLCGNWAKDWML